MTIHIGQIDVELLPDEAPAHGATGANCVELGEADEDPIDMAHRRAAVADRGWRSVTD